MEHTITTEQIKALANLAYFNDFKNKLVEMFPSAFSTIMDRVKTVEDALSITNDPRYEEAWLIHTNRTKAFDDASAVHTALCEGWVPTINETVSIKPFVVNGCKFNLPFLFETAEKRDYFQTHPPFAALLKTIITGQP